MKRTLSERPRVIFTQKEILASMANSVFFQLSKFLDIENYVQLAICSISLRDKVRSLPLDTSPMSVDKALNFLLANKHPNLRSFSIHEKTLNFNKELIELTELLSLLNLENLEIIMENEHEHLPLVLIYENFRSCSKLKKLKLINCQISPIFLSLCSKLEYLYFIPAETGLHLENSKLKVLHCDTIQNLMLNELPNLEVANISCVMPPELKQSTNLKELTLKIKPYISILPSYSHLVSLKTMCFTMDFWSMFLAGFANCLSLTDLTLNLNKVEELDVTPLATCINLVNLSINTKLITNQEQLLKCTHLDSILLSPSKDYSYLSLLKSVSKLSLNYTPVNLDVLPLPGLPPNLKHLEIRCGFLIRDINSITSCKKLESFTSFILNIAEGYAPLSLLLVLKTFTVEPGCKFHVNEGYLPLSLTKVSIPNGVDSLDCIANCSNIEYLLIGTYRCTFFARLGNYSKLISLYLTGNFIDENLDLSNCSELTHLYLHKTDIIRNLVLETSKLESLDIENCTNLIKLPDLSNCTQLKKINLECCYGLRSLGKLPSKVTILNISNCTNLSSLEEIKNCTSLETLSIVKISEVNLSLLSSCSKLEKVYFSDTDIIGMENLLLCPRLKKITLDNCGDNCSILNLEKIFNVNGRQLTVTKFGDTYEYIDREYLIKTEERVIKLDYFQNRPGFGWQKVSI